MFLSSKGEIAKDKIIQLNSFLIERSAVNKYQKENKKS